MNFRKPTFCLLLAATIGSSFVSVPSRVIAQDSTDTPTDTKTADEPKLTALEIMQKAEQADANTRYGLLNTISPRGADADDRKEIVRLLIEQLDSSYPDIRARAATTIGLFGEDAKPAVPKLIELLSDAEQTVSLESVWVPVSKALSKLGPEIALDPLMMAIPSTFEVTISKNENQEYQAELGDRIKYYGVSAAIAGMGEKAKSTTPAFIEILRFGPETRRWATMFTLEQFGDAAAEAIPDFIQNLDHADFNIKVIACRNLSNHGAKSMAAAPKLLKLMEKQGNMLSTRTLAAMCLGAIGPVEGIDSVELFKKMIQEPNAFSQERGLIALGRLGKHAKKEADFVTDLMEDPEFSQKPEAARTLWQITGEADRSLELLMNLIDHPTYDSRVFEILKEFGPAAWPVADKLADRLQSEDQSMRQIFLEIFEAMGEKALAYEEQIEAAYVGATPDTEAVVTETLQRLRK